MLVPLDTTGYIANNLIFKQAHQETAEFYLIESVASCCSRKIKYLCVKHN